jgi:hypothetical protein
VLRRITLEETIGSVVTAHALSSFIVPCLSRFPIHTMPRAGTTDHNENIACVSTCVCNSDTRRQCQKCARYVHKYRPSDLSERVPSRSVDNVSVSGLRLLVFLDEERFVSLHWDALSGKRTRSARGGRWTSYFFQPCYYSTTRPGGAIRRACPPSCGTQLLTLDYGITKKEDHSIGRLTVWRTVRNSVPSIPRSAALPPSEIPRLRFPS